MTAGADCTCGHEYDGHDANGCFPACGCTRPAPESDHAANEALEQAASALDDLALTLMTTSDDNPEGNSLTAAVVQKCADIVRQHKEAPMAERDEINAASMDRSAGRWCDRCEQHGSHYTERHDEFLARARSVAIPPAERGGVS